MDALSSIPQGTYKLSDLMATSAARMEQDAQRAEGEAEQEMIEAAGRVQAREPGKGEQVDVTG